MDQPYLQTANMSPHRREMVLEIGELRRQYRDQALEIDWTRFDFIRTDEARQADDDCSFCCIAFKETDLLVKHKACGHNWHAECFLKGVKRLAPHVEPRCAMCRSNMLPDDDEQIEDCYYRNGNPTQRYRTMRSNTIDLEVQMSQLMPPAEHKANATYRLIAAINEMIDLQVWGGWFWEDYNEMEFLLSLSWYNAGFWIISDSNNWDMRARDVEDLLEIARRYPHWIDHPRAQDVDH